MEKKPRRTPEQVAAYHFGIANRAKARAAKKARTDDTRLKILAGSAVIKSFIEGKYTMNELVKWDGLYAFLAQWLDDKDREFARQEIQRRKEADKKA